MNVLVEHLGWVLVHSLWQFAGVVIVAGGIVSALRRDSAALRFGVLVVAMGVVVAAPAVTWWVLLCGDPAIAVVRQEPASRPEEPIREMETAIVRLEPDELKGHLPPPSVGPTPGSAALDSASAVDVPRAALAPVDSKPSWNERAALALRPWLGWVVAAWSIGVILGSLRPVLGLWTLWRLKRVGVSPVPDEVLAAMSRVAQRLGLRRAVSVLQSTLARVPVVVGYFRPVILLPVSLATTIPVAQLEAILVHELAHVRRHDFVVNLLQTLVETLFFYHPAVWWLSRRIRVEREHCCDDLVVRLLGNRVEYGRALVAVEELRGRSSVLALGVNDGSLPARVRRVLGVETEAPVTLWPAAILGLALLSVALGLSMTWSLATKEVDANNVAQSKRDTIIADLPGGITVELVGVGFHPSKDRDWWKADGTKLEQRPYETLTNTLAAGLPQQAHCREFEWVISGLPPDYAVTTEYGLVSQSHGGKSVQGRWVGDHVSGPFKTETASIRLGLTTELFEQSITVDRDGHKQVAAEMREDLKLIDDRFEPVWVEEADGKVVLILQGPPLNELNKLAAWELHAIDVEGKKHASSTTYPKPSARKQFAGQDDYHVVFPLPISRLDRFEYRLRPYRHWVTFENVSLQPGKMTEVKVKVESSPHAAPIQPVIGRDPEVPQGIGHDSVMCWSSDSRQFYTQGHSLKLLKWEMNGSKILNPAASASPDNEWFAHANSIAASSRSGLVALGTNVGTVQLWNGNSLSFQKQIKVEPEIPRYTTYAIALSPDEKLVAEYGDTSGHLYEIATMERLCKFGNHQGRTWNLAFSPDGQKLAALHDKGDLTLWSIPDGTLLAEWSLKHIREKSVLQWSRAGDLIAVVSDGQVVFVTPASGSTPRVVIAPDTVCILTPQDVLSGNFEGNHIRGDFPDGIDWAGATALAPDFKTVASVTMDASAAIWNVETRSIIATLAPPPTLRGTEHPGMYLERMMFSPDGRRLACTAGAFGGDVITWTLSAVEKGVAAED